VLLWLEPFVESYVINLLDHVGAVSASPPSEWRRVQVKIEDTQSAEPADDMTISIDIANITGGVIDSTWTTADYDKVDTWLAQLVSGYSVSMSPRLKFTEFRYYRMAFNDYTVQKPFWDAGPPERVTPVSWQGTAGGDLPGQMALSITELTAFPHNWGRFYWPSPGPGLMTGAGHFTTQAVDALCQQAHDAYAGMMGQEFFPVVPTTQVGKVPARGLLTVSGIQVDDVPDVIRRRRPRGPLHKKVLPLP